MKKCITVYIFIISFEETINMKVMPKEAGIESYMLVDMVTAEIHRMHF